MTRSDDDKLNVQQATDLVRLVGEQVALRPKGREFVGLCPFHDDQSPSMYVSPQKQIYKCFSCGAGGDVFTFAMEYHKMSFREALEHLAQRAGIELTRRGKPEDAGKSSERQQIADANEKALGFFRSVLRHDEHGRGGRDYLQARGVSDEMIEAFALGLAPDRWDGLTRSIATKGWPTAGFLGAGLIAERGSHREGTHPENANRNPSPDRCYDRFRHRLIFPIHDALGRPIAFGGRVLPDPVETKDDPTRDAKYLNSPESILFDKSATLYGLHLAKKPIIDSKTAVIVEGYTDVIACHQAGFGNVVATLGTSLTKGHAQELRRYAEKVVLVFDADEAGQKAADRAVEVFLTGDLDVSIVVLPEGQDPADLMKEDGGGERWKAALDAGSDALTYRMSRLKQSLDATDTLTARQHRIEAAIDDLVRLGLASTGPVRRSLVIRKLASVVEMNEGQLDELLTARRKALGRRGPASAEESGGNASTSNEVGAEFESDGSENLADASSGRTLAGIGRAERQFLACLVREPSLFDRGLPDGRPLEEELTPGDLTSPACRELYEMMYDRLTDNDPPTLAELSATLTEAGKSKALRCLTTADAEVDAAVDGEKAGPRGERLHEIFDAAVATLRRHQHDLEYERDKQSWLSVSPSEGDAAARAKAAQRLLQRRAGQPFAARIPTVTP